MAHDRYDIQWIGHCQFLDKDGSDHNKIWGWFIYNDPSAPRETPINTSRWSGRGPRHAYVFWARTGKTPSFKKHMYSIYDLNALVRSKTDHKYTKIEINDLLNIWPTIYEDLDNKFIFHLLAENI